MHGQSPAPPSTRSQSGASHSARVGRLLRGLGAAAVATLALSCVAAGAPANAATRAAHHRHVTHHVTHRTARHTPHRRAHRAHRAPHTHSATGTPAFTLPSGPFAGRALYLDPNTTAAAAAAAAGGTNAALDRLAATPQATWLTGGSPAQAANAVRTEVHAAAATGAVTEFVVYDLPNRDCSGGQSAGGAAAVSAYQDYVEAVSAALRGAYAIVVLEPDALADLGCLDAGAQQARLQLLRWAVRTLVQPHVDVYLDGGHAGWQSASTMAYRLIKAGIYYARGFAVNVSNFDSTASETAYGYKISSMVGWKRFVIDTSRNGGTTAGGWCNPAGARLGAVPGTPPSSRAVDALLWIKHPGESDGSCGTSGTAAGGFDSGLAQSLAG